MKDFLSWLYFSGSFEVLWTWTLIHTTWTLQYLSERILFLRLTEVLICGPYFFSGPYSMAENYQPVSLLSMVSKVFEKRVNNRLMHPSENGFRSSWSTADPLIMVYDGIAGLLIGLGLLELLTINLTLIFKAFFGMLVFFKSCEVQI